MVNYVPMLRVERGAEQTTIEALARAAIAHWLADKEIVKIIFVKDRLINFVIK